MPVKQIMTDDKELQLLHDIFEPRNMQFTVARDRSDEVTSAGIYLSKGSLGESVTGRVVRCAEDCTKPVEQGKRVLFDEFCTKSMKIGGRELVLVQQENILGVVLTDETIEKGARE